MANSSPGSPSRTSSQESHSISTLPPCRSITSHSPHQSQPARRIVPPYPAVLVRDQVPQPQLPDIERAEINSRLTPPDGIPHRLLPMFEQRQFLHFFRARVALA